MRISEWVIPPAMNIISLLPMGAEGSSFFLLAQRGATLLEQLYKHKVKTYLRFRSITGAASFGAGAAAASLLTYGKFSSIPSAPDAKS